MQLSNLYRSPVVTISPDQSVQEAAELMKRARVGSIVITRENKPVGILTDRDIVVRVIAGNAGPDRIPVREVMSPRPITIQEKSDIWDVIRLMKNHGVRRLPVVSPAGEVVGLVTLDDIIEVLGVELAALGRLVWNQEKPMREMKTE